MRVYVCVFEIKCRDRAYTKRKKREIPGTVRKTKRVTKTPAFYEVTARRGEGGTSGHLPEERLEESDQV